MAKTTSTTQIAARFLAYPAPRVEVAAFLVFAGSRALAAGRGQRLTWADAAVAGAYIVAMPFVEWLVHSRLLHAKPIAWRGRFLLLPAARAHAAHHAEPRNERLTVTPLAGLLPMVPVAAAAAILPSWPLRATAAAMLALLVLSTEWVHFLVHAQTSPRSAWLRRRSRAHRLHHFRNDRYWFGLTSGIADAVMRTAPGRDQTPLDTGTNDRFPPVERRGPGVGATMRRPGLTAASRDLLALCDLDATGDRRTDPAEAPAISGGSGDDRGTRWYARAGREEASPRRRRAIATGRAACVGSTTEGQTFGRSGTCPHERDVVLTVAALHPSGSARKTVPSRCSRKRPAASR